MLHRRCAKRPDEKVCLVKQKRVQLLRRCLRQYALRVCACTVPSLRDSQHQTDAALTSPNKTLPSRIP